MGQGNALTRYLSTVLISALLAAAGMWSYVTAKSERDIAALETKYAQAQSLATEKAHADTLKLQAQADKAAADSAARYRALAVDRDRTRAAADGLRTQLANSARGLPTATCDSTRDYGIAASDVIGECSTRLVEVAEKADRAIGEVILLRDAWPSSE